jgi:DNA-binding NarL/FixJ family response regulator
MTRLRRYGAPYTSDDDARLRELAADGYDFASIAADLGRTHQSVRTRAHVLQVRHRGPGHWYKLDRRTAVLDGVKAGLTVGGIAARLGVGQGWVCILIAELVAKGLVGRSGRKRSLKLWVK